MIHLMLADLGWPADEFLALFFPVPVVVFDFDVLVPLCFPHAWQGEATFFCFVGAAFADDHRVEHDDVAESGVYDDDAFFHADHICRHADACLAVCCQCVLQISSHLQIFLCRRDGFLSEEENVSHNWFYHLCFLSLSALKAEIV